MVGKTFLELAEDNSIFDELRQVLIHELPSFFC
jgi:hypothetical protein